MSPRPRCVCPSGHSRPAGTFREHQGRGTAALCGPCAKAGCTATRLSPQCPGLRHRSRYGVRKVAAPDVRGDLRAYGSKGEAVRGVLLAAMQRGGAIEDLQYQVRFELRLDGARVVFTGGVLIDVYIADFTYTETESRRHVVEDFKNGLITRDFLRKQRWMREAYGIDIRISGSTERWRRVKAVRRGR